MEQRNRSSPSRTKGRPNYALKSLRQYAWTFSSTRREIPSALTPSATKYTPNYFVGHEAPTSFTIGTKPAKRGPSEESPAPGDYNVKNRNYTGSVFISTVPKKSSILPTVTNTELYFPPVDFLRKAKGGKIPDAKKLPRFTEVKSSTPGPGTYPANTNPTSNIKGTSFGKAPRVPASRIPARFQKFDVDMNPGPATYDLYAPFDRIGQSDMSFSSAVYLSRHIPSDVATGPQMMQDQHFIANAAHDIKRYKMMSIFKSS